MNLREHSTILWGLLWHGENKRDGVTEHFIRHDCLPVLFKTKRQAREYALKCYGYIKTRKDLRVEPHGWRLPRPIRVRVAKVSK